jgi:hypothetical protein
MSPREKNLLILFATAGFIILNLLAFNFHSKKKLEIRSQLADAEQALILAESIAANRDEVSDEIQWLNSREPEPAAYQDVQSNLQQLIERESQVAGLTIKPNSQKLLATDQTAGNEFHRAKVQISVTGTEKALYAWFSRLNLPDQLRAATNIQLSPNREDDTKIDCTTVIEQWFIPATGSGQP